MTDAPKPPPDEPDAPVPWEALEALAAGELLPEEADALRVRIEAEPRLAAAYAEARRIEALLRDEPPYAAPLGLTRRVLAAVVPEAVGVRPRPLATLARVAAVVLVFFSNWFLVGGETPALAAVHETPIVTAALPAVDASVVVPDARTWYRSPVLAEATKHVEPTGTGNVPGGAPALAGLGLLLILGGIGLAARWHARSVPAGGGDA